MKDHEQERIAAYTSANSAIQNLYGSDILGKVLRAMFDMAKIDSARYNDFVDVFGDVILGLTKFETIYASLTSRFFLSSSTASTIIANVVREVNNPLFQISIPILRTPAMPQPPVVPPAFTSPPRAPVVDTPFYGPPVKAPEMVPTPIAPRMPEPPAMPKAPNITSAPATSFQASASNIPPVRVMPHSKAEAKEAERATELPNALLRNLQSALAHGEGDHEAEEHTAPKTSYNSLLDSNQPPKSQPPPR